MLFHIVFIQIPISDTQAIEQKEFTLAEHGDARQSIAGVCASNESNEVHGRTRE